MRRMITFLVPMGMTGFLLVLAAPAAATDCPPDSVQSGNLCMDKYEASVWETTDPTVIRLIQSGRITLAKLLAAGAVQHGVSSHDYGKGCLDTGNGCVDFYAVSIPRVTPSTYLTWFQAAAAARNSGKRLPTNAEWQVAAFGTPDLGTDDGTIDCNIGWYGDTLSTGSRSACVSDVGAFDMVGNAAEWVADWTPRSTFCISAMFFGDRNCLAGTDGGSPGPGALLRGGGFAERSDAGVFEVRGDIPPVLQHRAIGFRAAR